MATGSILAFRDPILDANISQAALDNLTLALSAMQREAAVAYAFEDSYLKESIITVALSTMFFGLFTVLAGVAAYVLSSKGIKRTTTAIMLTAILLMWMSTVAYWIGTIVAAAEAYTRVHNLMLRSLGQANMMQDCLYPPTANSHVAPKGCQRVPETEPLYNIEEYEIHDCIGTVALTVNVIIGDTIVWWRALVLWPDNRVVRSVCAIMILLTTVTGVMDAKDACKVVEEVIHDFTHPAPGSSSAVVYVSGSTTGIWFGGDVWGYIALLFSLSTNIVATTLIAYRAWEHRRIIMSYLKGSSPRTQVERTLALLVESGLLYCGLWVVIAVYELSYAASPLAVLESTGFVRFKHGLYYMMQGCIVPLIGMYPTLIIVVCAVDKSLHGRSFDDDGAQNAASLIFAGGGPLSRRRGTLSELLSTTTAYAGQEDEESPQGDLSREENDSGSSGSSCDVELKGRSDRVRCSVPESSSESSQNPHL